MGCSICPRAGSCAGRRWTEDAWRGRERRPPNLETSRRDGARRARRRLARCCSRCSASSHRRRRTRSGPRPWCRRSAALGVEAKAAPAGAGPDRGRGAARRRPGRPANAVAALAAPASGCSSRRRLADLRLHAGAAALGRPLDRARGDRAGEPPPAPAPAADPADVGRSGVAGTRLVGGARPEPPRTRWSASSRTWAWPGARSPGSAGRPGRRSGLDRARRLATWTTSRSCLSGLRRPVQRPDRAAVRPGGRPPSSRRSSSSRRGGRFPSSTLPCRPSCSTTTGPGRAAAAVVP